MSELGLLIFTIVTYVFPVYFDKFSVQLNSTTPECSVKTVLWTALACWCLFGPLVFLKDFWVHICKKQTMYSNFFFKRSKQTPSTKCKLKPCVRGMLSWLSKLIPGFTLHVSLNDYNDFSKKWNYCTASRLGDTMAQCWLAVKITL